MICYYAIICVYVFKVKMTYCAIREFSWEGMGIKNQFPQTSTREWTRTITIRYDTFRYVAQSTATNTNA